MSDLNWVAARSECSARVAFARLLAGAKRDVEDFDDTILQVEPELIALISHPTAIPYDSEGIDIVGHAKGKKALERLFFFIYGETL